MVLFSTPFESPSAQASARMFIALPRASVLSARQRKKKQWANRLESTIPVIHIWPEWSRIGTGTITCPARHGARRWSTSQRRQGGRGRWLPRDRRTAAWAGPPLAPVARRLPLTGAPREIRRPSTVAVWLGCRRQGATVASGLVRTVDTWTGAWTGGYPYSCLCCNEGLNRRSSRSGKLCQALKHLVADPEVTQNCRTNPSQWYPCNGLQRRKLSRSGSCTGLDASCPRQCCTTRGHAKACSRTWGAPLQNLPRVAL